MKVKKMLIITITFSLLFIASMASALYVEIGTGTTYGSYPDYYWPFGNYWENCKTQTLYLSSELGSAQTFTEISFNIERVATSHADLVDFTVNFLHTDDTALTPGAYHDMTGCTEVFFSSSYTLATATGWNDIDITDFAYNGTQNLIVEIIWGDMGGYASTYYRNYKTDDGAKVTRTLYGYADSETPPLYDGSSTLYSNIRLHYQIAGAPGMPTDPNPVNLAFPISINTGISWTNGADTDDTEILFDTVNPPVNSVYDGVAVDTLTNALIGGPLSYATPYYWQVIAKNSAKLETAGPVWSFTTECGTYSAPFSENFDGVALGEIPICWSRIVGYSYGYVKVSDVTSNSAPNNLRMYNSSSTTAAFIAATPQLSDLTSQLNQIRFYGRSPDACDVIIGTMSDPTDEATFTTYQTINLTTTYTEYTVMFGTGYTGTDQYIAFKHGLNSTYDYLNIDDFVYEPIPSCPPPSDLTTTNITQTTADLGWTENGTATTWEVEWDTTGFTQGTGNTITGITSNPYTLNPPLTANTTYDWYVRADCGGGDYSRWIGPATFTTLCTAVTTFPYTEGFEDDWVGSPAAPPCWLVVDNNSDGDKWYQNTSSTYAHTGSKSATIYTDYNSANDDWLITPQLDLSGKTDYRLKFWTRARSSGEPEELQVLLSTTNTDISSFTNTLMASTPIDFTTYTEYTLSLAAYSSTVYIAFVRNQPPADGYYLYLDDVTVEEIPPVPEMILSETSHDFGFVEEGTSADWDVTISNTGAADLVISGTTVGSPFSCSYTGTITPGNDDDATISFGPSKGLTGIYTDTLVFHNNATCCDSEVVLTGYSYPSGYLFEDFEASTDIPSGWDTYVKSTSTYAKVRLDTYGDGHSGDHSVELYNSNDATDSLWLVLITPEVNISGSDTLLSFWLKGEADCQLIVGTMDDPADTNTFSPIDTVDASNTTYEERTVNIAGVSKGVHRVAFKLLTTSTYRNIYVDDVILPPRFWGTPGTPANPTPSDLATGQLLAGTLDWDDCQYAQTYDVYLENVNPPTVKIAEDITHSDTLYSVPNLNTTYYWKVVAKNPGAKFETEGPVWSFTTLGACAGLPLTEDFESGFDIFDNAAGNDVDWTLNDTLFTSTTHSAHNVYEASNENILVQTCVMDLTAKANPVLSFQHIAKTEGNYDECYVEISTDAGATWIILPDLLYHGSGTYENPLYNNPEGPCFDEDSYTEWGTGTEIPDNTWWKQEAFDLIPYNTSTQAMIRFRLTSDGSGQRFGWLIDDISIDAWTAPGAPTNPVPTDNAINVALSPTLSWTNNGVVDSSIVTWKKDAAMTPTHKDTVYTNSFTITDTLEKGTEYKWKVTCYNPVGSASTVNPPDNYWHFTTAGDGYADGIVYYDDGSKAQVPIEYAVVTCEGVSDTTNAAGEYFLGPIPSGERVITTEHINFVTKLDTVNVTVGDTLPYDIEMQWDLHTPQNLSAVGGDSKVDLEWQEPLPLGEIKYDDGTVEAWYWVSGPSTDSCYFNVRFNAPINGNVTHIAVFNASNGADWNEIMFCPDDGTGNPDLANPYQSFSDVPVTSTISEGGEWELLELTTPQGMAAGDTFYVVTRWPDGSADGPFVGTDKGSNSGRSAWTNDAGVTWNAFSYNFIMRAYMTTAKGETYTLTSGPSTNEGALPVNTVNGKTRPYKKEIEEIAMSYCVPRIIASSGAKDKALINYKISRGIVSGTYTYLHTTSALTYTDNTASNNTEYFYVVSAIYDEGESGYSNEASAYPMGAASIPYTNNFDTDNGGFFGNGDWEWGAPTYVDGPTAYSSPNVWGTDLDSTYSNNSNSYLYQPFDLSAKIGYGYKVNFAHWDSMETNCDYGYFAVDHDNDGVYNILATYTGYNTTWTEAEIIIPDSLCTAYTKLAFIFTSDVSVVKSGFYIDNLSVDEYIPPQISINPTSFTKTLLQNNTTTDNLTIGNNGGTGADELVYTAIKVYAAKDRTVVLSENFDTGIPGSWTIVDGGASTDTWYGATDYGGSTLDGTPFAFVDSDGAGSVDMDEQLISPSIDVAGYADLTLEFDQYYNDYSGGPDEVADVDVWDGSNWQNVYTAPNYDVGGWSAPDHQVIDIVVYANADLKVRFHYYNANWDYYWAVDNVEISGTMGVPWLTLDGGSSTSDTVATGNTDDIIVGFDATGMSKLAKGTYNANIIINSNDPDSPVDTVAVTMQVYGVENVLIGISGNDVVLNWDAIPLSNLTYHIYRSTDPYTGFTETGTSPTNSYTDVGAAASAAKYFYYVTADTGTPVAKPVIIHRKTSTQNR